MQTGTGHNRRNRMQASSLNELELDLYEELVTGPEDEDEEDEDEEDEEDED